MVAALLAVFLGIFGMHHFYLGNTTKGVFYLCIFWTFLPAIMGLIDAAVLFRMSDGEFNDTYN